MRAFKSVGGGPIVFDRVKGAYCWDVDGNKYIDYVGSWGPAIVGAANDEVNAALVAQIEKGTSFGAPCELEVRAAGQGGTWGQGPGGGGSGAEREGRSLGGGCKCNSGKKVAVEAGCSGRHHLHVHVCEMQRGLALKALLLARRLPGPHMHAQALPGSSPGTVGRPPPLR